LYPKPQTIKVTKQYHREKPRIFLKFEWNADWIRLIRSIPSARYSSTHRSWHIPYESRSWKAFKLLEIPYELPAATCTPAQASLLEIHGYLEKLAKSRVGDSTLHTAVNAVKYYYTSVIYLDDLDVSKIKRPRKEKRLPKVLSIQEVNALLSQSENSKHLSMLYLLYGSGLRLNELVQLKVADILWNRSKIHIVSGKGKKNRYVMFAESQRQILHQYFIEYKPTYWLFEGQETGEPYSERSVQQVVKRASHQAGITRRVTPHVRRHCFATHLRGNGAQLPYIQQLLGHNSIKTTMIYLETSGKNYANIVSPLDYTLKNNIEPN